MQKKLALLLTVILLFCGNGLIADATNRPDPTQKGSIEIVMQKDATPVPGGSLTLYQVGTLIEENGAYRYELVESLQTTGLVLDDLQSPQLAKELAAKVASAQGNKKEIDAEGRIAYTDLELGVYLLVQEEAAKGYSKLDPFLVTVPEVVNGEYIYQVQAGPKITLVPETTPAPTPTAPPTPVVTPQPQTPPTFGDGSTVQNPSDSSAETLLPKLPQTGQLNWPIPVMAVVGLWLFVMGWILRFGQKRDSEKK